MISAQAVGKKGELSGNVRIPRNVTAPVGSATTGSGESHRRRPSPQGGEPHRCSIQTSSRTVIVSDTSWPSTERVRRYTPGVARGP